MAIIAVIPAGDMRRMFAGGLRSVVTTDAVAADSDVSKVRRGPRHRRMTVVAGIGSGDMRRVLPSRDAAIVARRADTQDLGMIDRADRAPDCRAMTVFTNIGGLDMGGALAGCPRTVVTVYAPADDICMIKYCGDPERRLMAVVALVAGRKMVRLFARRGHVVMARCATSGHGGVIHESNRAPCGIGMTVRTELGGRNMICRFYRGTYQPDSRVT